MSYWKDLISSERKPELKEGEKPVPYQVPPQPEAAKLQQVQSFRLQYLQQPFPVEETQIPFTFTELLGGSYNHIVLSLKEGQTMLFLAHSGCPLDQLMLALKMVADPSEFRLEIVKDFRVNGRVNDAVRLVKEKSTLPWIDAEGLKPSLTTVMRRALFHPQSLAEFNIPKFDELASAALGHCVVVGYRPSGELMAWPARQFTTGYAPDKDWLHKVLRESDPELAVIAWLYGQPNALAEKILADHCREFDREVCFGNCGRAFAGVGMAVTPKGCRTAATQAYCYDPKKQPVQTIRLTNNHEFNAAMRNAATKGILS